jgi:hypothetical protein
MPRTQRRHLRRVHHTAATERDDDIRPAGLDALRHLVHHINRRLRRHLGKRPCEQLRIEQGLRNLLRQPRARHAGITDEEDLPPAIRPAEFDERFARAASSDDPARQMIFEGGKRCVHQ